MVRAANSGKELDPWDCMPVGVAVVDVEAVEAGFEGLRWG